MGRIGACTVGLLNAGAGGAFVAAAGRIGNLGVPKAGDDEKMFSVDEFACLSMVRCTMFL